MTKSTDKADQISEWLRYLHDAIRFGSKNPVQVANVLTYGVPDDPKQQTDQDCRSHTIN